jgi:hypothetical protein
LPAFCSCCERQSQISGTPARLNGWIGFCLTALLPAACLLGVFSAWCPIVMVTKCAARLLRGCLVNARKLMLASIAFLARVGETCVRLLLSVVRQKFMCSIHTAEAGPVHFCLVCSFGWSVCAAPLAATFLVCMHVAGPEGGDVVLSACMALSCMSCLQSKHSYVWVAGVIGGNIMWCRFGVVDVRCLCSV